ncbi:hypothetical protein [Enterobacter hormaechei]|uniref:hypothetical protein n=1 Tax=Enterobacter hormaechei TaxID=158836 RepID=UPI0026F07BAD|nr:hypothetical protein [Enterobacter hormaechei]
MYSMLIKDRAYPISVYLSHMMRVKGFSRTEAIKILTHAAITLGLREQKTPPANNTVSEWGRTSEVPQWAVISAMKVLEQLGKVPYLDKEWAFWAYATAELDTDNGKITGKWAEWLSKARRYKHYYSLRGVIRKQCEAVSDSNLASRIVIFSKGNCLAEVTFPQIFFELDESKEGLTILEAKLKASEPLTYSDVQSITIANEVSAKLKSQIELVLQELMKAGFCTRHLSGNISISFDD